MASTYAGDISELFSLLADSNGAPVAALSSAGVVQVFDHEPKAGDGQGNCYVTVTAGGMLPDFWRFTIRVYSRWQESAKVAHDVAVAAMVAIDTLIATGSSSVFGAAEWSPAEPSPEIEAFVVTGTIIAGRADLV